MFKRKKEKENMPEETNAYCSICNKPTRLKVMTTNMLKEKDKDTRLFLVANLACDHYNIYEMIWNKKSFTSKELEKKEEIEEIEKKYV